MMPRYPTEARAHAPSRETGSGDHRALVELEGALRSPVESILVTGGSARAKLQLLEAIWLRPPEGFAPILVPCRGSSADDIAARILEMTRTVPVRDAEAALARMMRTQSIRGARPVLLLDDLESVSLAALSRLRSIADGSRVEVRWIAAGSEGGASDAALAILPCPVRVVVIDAASLRSRDLSTRKIEAAVPSVADTRRISASSEPVAIPRLDPAIPRAAPEIPRTPVDSAPVPVRSRAPTPPLPPPAERGERAIRPIRAGVPALPRSPSLRADAPSAAPRMRAPKRERRPLLSVGARRVIMAGIVACAALALVVDRGPLLLAWAAQEADGSIRGASSFAVDAWSSLRDAAGSLASQVESGGRRIAESTVATAEHAVDSVRALAAPEPSEAPPPPPVAAAPPQPVQPAPVQPAKPPVPAPGAAPIHVGINSDPWSNVAVDGVDFGSTPLSIPLAPGPHRFRAEMADGRIIEKEIEVAEGRSEIVFR
jgi:hypothetical protein